MLPDVNHLYSRTKTTTRVEGKPTLLGRHLPEGSLTILCFVRKTDKFQIIKEEKSVFHNNQISHFLKYVRFTLSFFQTSDSCVYDARIDGITRVCCLLS